MIDAINETCTGQVHVQRGELDEAMDCFQEVLRIQRRNLRDNDPSIAHTLNSIANIHLQNGFTSVSNKCVCPRGYYPTLDQFQCLSCGTGCSSCATGAKCDICEPGYTPSDSSCVLNCPTGTFNAGD